MRDFAAIHKEHSEKPTSAEFDLAASLLQKLSSTEFYPEDYLQTLRDFCSTRSQ